MKKSLIALAVVGTIAAPAAFAATSNVDIYGKLRMSLDYVDINNGVGHTWQLNDQTSRLGFKGSEDLGGGLKAIWQVESYLGTARGGGEFSDIGNQMVGGRNTFVGLAGDFGTAIVGRHDTPYKIAGSADIFADTSADAQNNGAIIGYDLSGAGIGFDARVANAIAYISPTFSGVTIAAAVIPGESVSPGPHGLTDAYSLAALYANGPLTGSLAYEDHNNLYDENAWKLNVGYTFGDFKVGATYESQKDKVFDDKSKNYLVSGAYMMGPITLGLQYGKRNTDFGDDLTRLTAGAYYNLSKRTQTYVAYDHDKWEFGSDKVNVLTFGINHDF